MKLSEQIEYAATMGALKLCRILPENAVYALFKGLAAILHAVSGRRRNLSLRNMEIAFPEKGLAERKTLVKQSYFNISEVMAYSALIMAGRHSTERILSSVETSEWHKLEKAAESSDKGILVFSGHIGNWELMTQYTALRLHKPFNVIARKSNNQLLEDRIVYPLRERFGVNVFYKKNALRNIIKAAKRGETVGIMVDQKLNRQEGVSVPFFGREAWTTATPALVQIRFGIQTMPIFMMKVGHRKYRMMLGDLIEWTDNGKPMDDQVLELTCLHQKAIEDMIRQYPDQWFWMHNRWGLPKEKR